MKAVRKQKAIICRCKWRVDQLKGVSGYVFAVLCKWRKKTRIVSKVHIK
jgi:hypothetical protein